jgi:hypothetical protein
MIKKTLIHSGEINWTISASKINFDEAQKWKDKKTDLALAWWHMSANPRYLRGRDRKIAI